MKTLIIGLLLISLTSLGYSQNIEGNMLSEVEIYTSNSDYIKSVEDKHLPKAIGLLEREVASFNVHGSSLHKRGKQNDYPDRDGNYNVKFANKLGSIHAVYDHRGKVLKTTERFINVKLPREILHSILNKYPDWTISKDMYFVKYNHNKELTRKYIIHLKNDNKNMKLRLEKMETFPDFNTSKNYAKL